LHQNYFRDYEASIGRYVQRDPIGLDGGINVFGYVGGRPIGFVDPEGKNAAAAIVIWIVSCAAWAQDKATNESFSDSINPELPPGKDKKRHCYASCLITQCMLGLPAAPTIGTLKEALDEYFGAGAEIDDIRANNVGVGYAYEGKNCKRECDNDYCS